MLIVIYKVQHWNKRRKNRNGQASTRMITGAVTSLCEVHLGDANLTCNVIKVLVSRFFDHFVLSPVVSLSLAALLLGSVPQITWPRSGSGLVPVLFSCWRVGRCKLLSDPSICVLTVTHCNRGGGWGGGCS